MKKITFVIPLRPPSSCNDWNKVSKACTGTLRSIAAQTSDNYQCLLVCHEPPEVIPDIKNLEICCVNFSTPKSAEERKKDKGLKIKQALSFQKKNRSAFSMNVDADDRIHKDLVSYIETHNSLSGWRVGKGYVYPGGMFVRSHNGDFDKLCGTSIICRTDELNEISSPIMIGHCHAKKHFEDIGTPLKLLPFFAAVKVVGYGDNITETLFLRSATLRRTIKKLFQMRIVTKGFIKDFSFDSYPAPKNDVDV